MDSWVAGDVDVVRNFEVVVFPSEYTGPVHIRFKAPSKPLEVVIRLVWGPWKLEQKVTVAPDGIALVFAKTRSGEGEPPLRVMADVAVGVAAHIGMPDDLPPGSVIDCNDGWGAVKLAIALPCGMAAGESEPTLKRRFYCQFFTPHN